jgi:hypothetical protein
MLQLDSIFSLFSNDKQTYNEELIDKDIVKFKIHLYNILKFKKIILNHIKTQDYIVKKLKESLPEWDEIDIINSQNSIVYNKAFDVIKDIDIKSIKDYLNYDITESIQYSINYFSSIEEYEKCSLLKEIIK